jgi:hypothetical protein
MVKFVAEGFLVAHVIAVIARSTLEKRDHRLYPLAVEHYR